MFIRFILVIYLIFNYNVKELLAQNNSGSNNLLSIVAIVNDEPITMMDLDARLRLIIISSNLPNNLEILSLSNVLDSVDTDSAVLDLLDNVVDSESISNIFLKNFK